MYTANRQISFCVNFTALKRAITNQDKKEIDAMIGALNKDIDDYNNLKDSLSDDDKKYFHKKINPIKKGLTDLGYKLVDIEE